MLQTLMTQAELFVNLSGGGIMQSMVKGHPAPSCAAPGPASSFGQHAPDDARARFDAFGEVRWSVSG